MDRRTVALLALLLVVSLAMVGCGSSPGAEEVVAVVNGVELTRQDFDREMRHTYAFFLNQYDMDLYAAENAEELSRQQDQALQRLVDQELIRQIAAGEFPPAQEGQQPTTIEIGSQEVEERASQYEEQSESRLALLRDNGFETYQEFIEFVEGQLRLERLQQTYGMAEQVHVRHILVATEEEAQQVLTRLAEGETFAVLAQELSQDPGSASQGGDLGWFGRGMTPAPFEEAAFSLEIGQVSEPVETRFGYHILEVLERETSYNDTAFAQWFSELKAQAAIVYYGLEAGEGE